jgi:acetate kinase
MKKDLILVLNSGSSSVKYSLFENLELVTKGIEENIGLKDGAKNHREAIKNIFVKLRRTRTVRDLSAIKIIGHRVVHGGEEFKEPVLLSGEIIRRLKKYSKLAPLHNPPNILGIEICRELLPQAKNVAVFDTEFYQSLAPESFLYALPRVFYEKHKIRRYGFHGISHQYVAETAEEILGRKIKRLITCHLGAGSSITAIKNGKPIDTSMGFTPLEGLVMESRSGSVDPAIPLYMIKELKFSPEEVDEILNKKSGFLGLCGLKDFREILKSKSPRAKLTYQIFLRSVVKSIGGYVALLGGLDAIVFTAGIGEGSARFRKDVMSHFKFLGGKIDEAKNKKHKPVISDRDSRVKIMVIPTNEELMIAKAAAKFIR